MLMHHRDSVMTLGSHLPTTIVMARRLQASQVVTDPHRGFPDVSQREVINAKYRSRRILKTKVGLEDPHTYLPSSTVLAERR